ncbi:hypothetical protein IEC97_14680 [Neobacillus cucumis]|uniref:hypothetical protein n=1 Tax=Neobacillus cucumis TaxID=1740721 RepID=UPI0018DF32C4|nr:hypothetical protein [Neobacillus cucumis]MBI0578609.1 hypothetical protein [Neobacillus cucumis]
MEEIEEIIDQYKISFSDLDTTDPFTIANSVYTSCEKIMPKNFIGIIRNLGLYEKTKADILQHLVFSTSMIQLIQNGGMIESNHSQCKKTVEELEKWTKLENSKTISNYNAILDKKIGDYFFLMKTLKENKSFNAKNKLIQQFEVPKAVAPFIFFTVINYEFFQDIKSKSLLSENMLDEKIELYKNFLKNKDNSQKVINTFLFEREYNFQLQFKILEIMESSDFKDEFRDKNKVYKVLSLLSLLPNIKGRLEYIKVFLKSKEMLMLSINEDGESFGYISKFILTEEQKEFNWIEEVSKIILRLALFVFPVMELLHFYITKLTNTNISGLQGSSFLIEKKNKIVMDSFSELNNYFQGIQKKFYQDMMDSTVFDIDVGENPADKDMDEIDKMLYYLDKMEADIYREVTDCRNRLMKKL